MGPVVCRFGEIRRPTFFGGRIFFGHNWRARLSTSCHARRFVYCTPNNAKMCVCVCVGARVFVNVSVSACACVFFFCCTPGLHTNKQANNTIS